MPQVIGRVGFNRDTHGRSFGHARECKVLEIVTTIDTIKKRQQA
jgi:hypothetical protein